MKEPGYDKSDVSIFWQFLILWCPEDLHLLRLKSEILSQVVQFNKV